MKEKEIGKLPMKGKPERLTNMEKSEFFKQGAKIFRDWNKLKEPERWELLESNPMQRVGIYCMVFSMFEDRLETFWWNCAYVHQ